MKTIKKILVILALPIILLLFGLGLYRLNVFSNSSAIISYKIAIDSMADNFLGLIDKVSGGKGKYQYMPGWVLVAETNTGMGKYLYQMPVTLIRVDINGKRILVQDYLRREYYVKVSPWTEDSTTVFSWGDDTFWSPIIYRATILQTQQRNLNDLVCNKNLITISWSSDNALDYWADFRGWLRLDKTPELSYVNLNLYTGVLNKNSQANEACN